MCLREGNQCKKSPLKKLNGSILLDEMSRRLDSYYEFYFQGVLLCSSSELYSYSQLCRETLFMLYCSHWVLFTAGHFTCLSTVSPKNIHMQKKEEKTLCSPWSTQPCSSVFSWSSHDHHFRFELFSFSFELLSLLHIVTFYQHQKKNITKKRDKEAVWTPTGYWQFIRHSKEADKVTVRSWAGVSLAEKIPWARNGGWKTGS